MQCTSFAKKSELCTQHRALCHVIWCVKINVVDIGSDWSSGKGVVQAKEGKKFWINYKEVTKHSQKSTKNYVSINHSIN